MPTKASGIWQVAAPLILNVIKFVQSLDCQPLALQPRLQLLTPLLHPLQRRAKLFLKAAMLGTSAATISTAVAHRNASIRRKRARNALWVKSASVADVHG